MAKSNRIPQPSGVGGVTLIPLADLTFDRRFYPHVNTDWVTITRYANAQKAGDFIITGSPEFTGNVGVWQDLAG